MLNFAFLLHLICKLNAIKETNKELTKHVFNIFKYFIISKHLALIRVTF